MRRMKKVVICLLLLGIIGRFVFLASDWIRCKKIQRMGLTGKIFFSGFGDNICSLDLSTGKCRRTGEKGGWDGGLALSPDGKKLAFLSSKEKEGLVIMDLKTKTKELIAKAKHGMDISWSPDGKKLSYWSNREEGRHRDSFTGVWENRIGTFVYDLEKREEKFLGEQIPNPWLGLSPDGKKIVFGNEKNSIRIKEIEEMIRKKGEYDDGITNIKQLVFPVYPQKGAAINCQWRQDGKKIIFEMDHSISIMIEFCGFDWICIINSDGTEERILKKFFWFSG